MSTRRFALACSALLLIAAMPLEAASLRLPKPKRGFQVRMSKFVLDAATEREVCEYRRLPNRKAIDVRELAFKLSGGTHHFAVWAYMGGADDSEFPQTMVESPGCTGVGPADGYNKAVLGGAPHGGRYRMRFPKGIALRLAPHQQVFLNAHYINGTPEPFAPEIVFNVKLAKPGTVEHHAESLTVGNYNINIQPRSTGRLVSEWRAPIDLNVIQLSSHQHRRGTRFTINRIEDGVDVGQIYENGNWESPYELWMGTPMRVRQGDGFRFTCEWRNDDDHAVRFGVTTEDEMCFVTGYYYRDDESQPIPTLPRCFPSDAGLLCMAYTAE